MRDPMTRKLVPFGTSVFTEYTALAQRHGAINLSQGYPDFDGPDAIKERACERIRRGHNQYAPSAGVPALRRAVAAKMQRFYGLEVDPEAEVTIFSGGTEALFSSIMGLCEPGDEVILLDPCYDSYAPSAVMAGASVRRVPLEPPSWTLDPDLLRAAFGPRSRLIVVNTPMNPCGKVFDRAELGLIAELCQAHDVIALCDEVYEHLTYDGAVHLPLFGLPGMRERSVCVSSTAKTFSLTGWKIGTAVAAPAVTRAIRSSHQFVTFCTPPPLQEAMAEAIAFGDSYYQDLRASYDARRRFMCQRLRELGFAFVDPRGSYYIAADVAGLGFDDGEAFCRMLPERHGVAAIPIAAFCADPAPVRSLVRIAFCKTQETLAEACDRLAGLRAG